MGAARTVKLDPRDAGPVIPPLLFGHNLEHTRRAMWQGLSAQLLANRKFAGEVFARNSLGKDVGSLGKVSPEGVVACWHGIGDGAKFAHDTSVGYAGNQSQKITIASKTSGGIGQKQIPLQKDRLYELRVYVKSDRATTATVRLCDDQRRQDYARHSATVKTGDWQECACRFTPLQTDEKSLLEITFDGPATVWLGAVSLLPADNFFGLRRDVVELLKEISVPVLRWPGGNFTLDYRWQDGLLPVDKRPPIKIGMSESQPFTNNCDCHEIGIDEFIELCRYLDAEPFITANVRPEDIGTADDAAAWVEYCNGSPETKWGSVRTQRGHQALFRVKYWSIGNELWGSHMLQGHSDAHVYAQRVAAYAPAMKQADPSIVLTAVGMPAPVWDGIVTSEAGEHFDYLSAHDYTKLKEQDVEAYRYLAGAATTRVLNILKTCRNTIQEKGPRGKRIGIAFDEWNVWHDWFIAPFANDWRIGPGDGAYTAGMLNLLCREFDALHIPLAAYFQPVNEGAVAVKPFSAELTSVGQVFRLFKAHHGQRLVKLQENSGAVDACASISADGKRLCVTVVSRDSGEPDAVEIALPAKTARASATVQILSARDLTPNLPLEERTEKAPVKDGKTVTFTLPRFSVALVTVAVG